MGREHLCSFSPSTASSVLSTPSLQQDNEPCIAEDDIEGPGDRVPVLCSRSPHTGKAPNKTWVESEPQVASISYFSDAVIKYYDQKQLKEGRVHFSLQFHPGREGREGWQQTETGWSDPHNRSRKKTRSKSGLLTPNHTSSSQGSAPWRLCNVFKRRH